MRGFSGGLGAATTIDASDTKLDTHSRAREHVDQRVDAEKVDLAANKIADPWLSDSKEGCCRTLREFACLNQRPCFHHQLGAKPQALGLPGSEAKVTEDVPAGLLNLHRHVSFLRRRFWSNSLNRDLARFNS
jgi:hypothetical protein